MTPDIEQVTRRGVLRTGVATATALALGASAVAGTAGAQDRRRNSFDLAGLTVFNPCNGEPVEITRGRLEVRRRVRAPEDGRYESALVVNTNGVQGVGAETGVRYVVTSSLANEVESSSSGPLSSTLEARLLVVSQGSTDNFVARLRTRLAVDDAGEVTGVSFEPVSACRG